MPVRVVALVLTCAAALITQSSAAGAAPSGDLAEWLFTPSEVVQVDLTLGQEAIEDLASEPGEYVSAGFEMHGSGGRAFGPWAIQLKLKGNASFRTLAGKAAFKLKFPSGSRPSGLRKLTLNNMAQDASKVREVIAYDLFRAMGVAAPRTGYAQVRVNGAAYGLYLNVETLDSVALPHWFPSTGHLYEGTYDYATGTPRSTLEPGGEAFFEVDEGDEDERADLQGLIAALHAGGAGPLATALGDHADLRQMARMLAAEAFLGDWDGYGWNVNNFYLHADASGRFSLLPWGADQTMQSWFPVEGGPWEVRGVLLRRCLEDVACRAVRRAALVEARALAGSLGLRARAAQLHAQLRPLIDADPRREHTLAASDADAADVQAFLAARAVPADPPATVPGPPLPPAPLSPGAPVPVAPAEAAPSLPELSVARIRAAARSALIERFGARFARGTARRLECRTVSAVAGRCRARWASRGTRYDRRVLVRVDRSGRVTGRIA